jgi:CDP-diacylglycerol--serine O-phosphatidyltransferase
MMQTAKTGIYWLPNLLTTAALFSGFYAIIAGVNGQYEHGAIAIFVAMVFDFLDGRVARLANATSEFGAEYDSLSDMVSFGVAPAMLIYSWGLQNLGKFGWVAAFIYVAAAALRLARFNTQVGIADKRYFQGLPSPAAAGILAAFVWVIGEGSIGQFTMIIALLLTVISGALMVSNFRYHSFKEFKLKERVPFITLILIVAISVVILIDPATLLLFALLAYAVSGLVITIWGLKERRATRAKSKNATASHSVAEARVTTEEKVSKE